MNEIAVLVPEDIGDKISVEGLFATKVFVDGRIGNITARLKTPQLEDFRHIKG